MTLIVSADDLGATPGVTASILEAVDHGCITSVSVLPNGADFEHAMDEVRRRPALRVSAHLNVVEGVPLLSPDRIPQLVAPDGFFRHSFPSLWLASLLPGRAAVRDQLRKELSAQLDRFRAALPPGRALSVDSHVHLHLIPMFLDVLTELHADYRFAYVRMLEEPFLRVRRRGALANYLGPNLVKHALLRVLSGRGKRRLRALGIPHCSTFVGVLFTGNMSAEVVRAALVGHAADPARIIEILFHPGSARAGEESHWAPRHRGLRNAYYSPWRATERESLKDPNLMALVASFESSTAPGSLP